MPPGLLLADAGTPLMWFGCFQLFFGNCLISILEAAILRRFFNAAKPFKVVLAANYASMVCGIGLIWLLEQVLAKSDPDPFRYGRDIVYGAWTASFVITVLVEAPFFARVLKECGPAKKMWKASIVANTASYAIIVPLAFFAGPTSALHLHTGWTSKMGEVAGWIYYVDAAGREVRRMRPAGAPGQFVLTLDSSNSGSRRTVAVEPDEQGSVARLVIHTNDGARVLVPKVGHGSQAARPEEFYKGFADIGWPNGGLSFATSEGASTGDWAYQGLQVRGHTYALETPFIEADWSSPTLLPNGVILVAMNGDIYLVDTSSNAAFRIKPGTSPSFLRDP